MDFSILDATPLLCQNDLRGGMASSTSLLAITAILLVFTLNFHYIPGPFFTKISGLPVLCHTLTLNRTRWIYALHTKYGRIVRLGPNEVSINDVDAITPVYNFEKTYFYEAFICYGKRNMFSTLDRKNHAPKRKNIGAEYSRTNVLRPESLTMVYDRCHQLVIQIVPDSPRDKFPLLNYMTQDIISGFFFGDKNGSRCLQGEDTDFLGA